MASIDFATLQAFVQARTNISARRLVAPGPDAAQLDALLSLAAAAPDHGQLGPWRFVLVPEAGRGRLAEAFAQALRERDANATDEELGKAREKAHRAPTLLVAVVRTGGDGHPEIPPLERVVSFGAALQNILLGAQALGFGAGLTSGQAMRAVPIRALFGLDEDEHAVCCVNIGTITTARGPRENRRTVAEMLSVLEASPTR